MSIDTDNRVIKRTCAALIQGVKYILHQGGTSSGKTFGILYSILFFALKYLPANSIISVVSQTLPHLKKGAINDFKRILDMTGYVQHVVENKSDHTFTLHNGTRIEFFSPDDEEKAKSGKRNMLFINEATGMSYAIAKQLMMRTSGTVILDWNPSGKFWLHRMLLPFLKPFEYLFTRSTYRDNKSVDKSIIDEIERLRLIDPSQYDVYGLGIEGKGTEIIYPNYEIVDEFPDTDRVGAGLDFGFTNNPSAGTRLAINDGSLWIDELFYKKGLSNKQIFTEFDELRIRYGRITGDSAEPKSIAELEEMGLDIVGAVKGPDSVKFGIETVKSYPLKITRRSLNVLDEIDGYKWKMKDGVPTNEPVKKNDHLMNAIMYGIQSIATRQVSMKPQVQKAREMGFTNLG